MTRQPLPAGTRAPSAPTTDAHTHLPYPQYSGLAVADNLAAARAVG